MSKYKLHWDILDKKRLDLLPKLKFLKDSGFYLAGGTGLALQIRHRVSVDFDFYNQKEFDSAEIYRKFQTQKSAKLLLNAMTENTLIIEINNIAISLFAYDYPIIKPFVTTEYVNIASLEDIAAMKLIAIIQRGIKRDFIDFYYLSKQLTLENIMSYAKKKYAGFNKYLALQAVIYFQDAEEKQAGGGHDRPLQMFEILHWKDIKKYFIEETRQLERKWRI